MTRRRRLHVGDWRRREEGGQGSEGRRGERSGLQSSDGDRITNSLPQVFFFFCPNVQVSTVIKL